MLSNLKFYKKLTIFNDHAFFLLMNTLLMHIASSPRQRCRIKTNPWLSGPDSSNLLMKTMSVDISLSSSGFKIFSEADEVR